MIAALERLILCAGPFREPECKTLDANPDYKPDYCALLPPIPRELRHGQWDEVYLIHGIEHFYQWEGVELIRNIYECLKPGGFVVLEQPNIEVCARVMLGLMESPTRDPRSSGINGIYGDPKHENPWMCHKWGWTPDTLRYAAMEGGFNADRIKTGPALSRPFAKHRDFRLEAVK